MLHEARGERRDVLSLPRALQGVGSALQAAKDLFDAALAEATRLTKDRDASEREELSTALGGGATGKGYTGSAPKGGAGALKELEKRQKSRGTRTSRDALDRAATGIPGRDANLAQSMGWQYRHSRLPFVPPTGIR